MNEGDVHLDAKNNLHITAPKILLNGEEINNNIKVVTKDGKLISASGIRFRGDLGVIHDFANDIIDVWPSSGQSTIGISVEGVSVGTASAINLVDSADVTYSAVYNAITNEIDITSTLNTPPSAYGTSLPGSPVDGQEYTLVNSTTNPSYQ